MMYSFPPAAAAPDSSRATGKDLSPRWISGADGDGEGESATGVGLADREAEGEALATGCCVAVQELRLKAASTPITKACLNPDSIRRSMFA
jgi:hypothetical protein